MELVYGTDAQDLAVPLNNFFMAYCSGSINYKCTFRVKAKIYRSTRATVMEELIATMKFLKINCWERPFTSHIAITRRNETSYNEKASQLRGLTAAVHAAFSKMAVFLIILVYVIIGNGFTAKQVIVMLALVEILHTNLSLFLPWCAQDGSQLLMSIKKIQVNLIFINYFVTY
jgi:ATP-binding cassette subfamily C (CFTR/MRP) protein 4